MEINAVLGNLWQPNIQPLVVTLFLSFLKFELEKFMSKNLWNEFTNFRNSCSSLKEWTSTKPALPRFNKPQLPAPLSSCSQDLDARGLGWGLCKCYFRNPLVMGGCCRVGDPHSKMELRTDLNEERRRSGAEVRSRALAGSGLLVLREPGQLLPLLPGQMFPDPMMTFFLSASLEL